MYVVLKRTNRGYMESIFERFLEQKAVSETYFGKKTAFTLAEVLITLGIIGVVAAMTMPSLIANNRNKAIEVSLQKNYSAMEQALLRISEDYGDLPNVSTIGGRNLKSELMKYMNVAKDCGWGTEAGDCIINPDFGIGGTQAEYKNYTQVASANVNKWDDGQFVLADGSLYMIENQNFVNRLYISVDVNGFGKRPNVWGKDVFTFQLMDDGKLLPMGADGTDYSADTYCSKTSASDFNGIGCAYKALTDKNFWK